MPATIDYLPLANNGGANVVTQGDYVAAVGGGALVNGYQAGLARSDQINKTLRQSSVMTAAMAGAVSSALGGINILDDGDVAALTAKILGAIKQAGSAWVVAGGAADAITATYSPAIVAGGLVDGLELSFRATAQNATATPTFAPNGLPAHTITKSGGAALAAGDIAGSLAEVQMRYNLANTRWELMNPAGAASANPLSFAKALLKYNGAGPTNLFSFNVSSITHTSGGNYIVNFTVSFSTANYVAVGSTDGVDVGGAGRSGITVAPNGVGMAAGSCVVQTTNIPINTLEDSIVYFAFFGAQ